MKLWCPLAHSDCQDGYTKESECQCVFWDSINNECIQFTVRVLADSYWYTIETIFS